MMSVGQAARIGAIFAAKAALIFLLIIPSAVVLSLLSQPLYAHILSFFLAAFLSSILILKIADKQQKDKSFKILTGFWVLFTGSLVLYYTGIAKEYIFVRIIGFFGAVIIELFLLFSVFVGQRRWKSFEEVLFTIALLAPIIGSILSFVIFADLYKIGILVSLLCSLANIMFNKSGYSVGVPELLRTPSSTDLSAFNNSYIISRTSVPTIGKVGVVDPKKKTSRKKVDDDRLRNRSISTSSNYSTT
jgi:hypothetical protein